MPVEHLWLNQQTPTIAGVVPDEATGLGTDRAIQPRRAKEFDGVASVVELESNVTLSGACAVSVWIKPSSFTRQIAGGEDNTNFFKLDSTTDITLKINNGTIVTLSTDATLSADTWYHLLVSRNASNDLTLYVDGIAQADTDNQGGDWVFRQIGTYKSLTAIAVFDGVLFDFRLYDRLLNAGEITGLADKKLALQTALDTVGHWKLDDTSSATCYDSRLSGNNGTNKDVTVETFNYKGSDVPYSWQNEEGYSDYENIIYKDTEDLDKWSKTGVTVSQDSALDPDGGADAWKITKTDSNPFRYVWSVITDNVSSTVVCDIWLGSGTFNSVAIGLSGGGWDNFDGEILSGVASLSTDGDRYVLSGISGWVKFRFKKILTATDTRLYIYPGTTASGGSGDYIYIYHPHVYRSGKSENYIHSPNNLDISEIVPLDPANPGKDVLGKDAQFLGRSPSPAQAIKSPCVTFDGVTEYLEVLHLVGTETVVSSGGTSTPTVSAGRIDFTAGTCWDLLLSDGSRYPMCENLGPDIHNTDGTTNHATLQNATTSPAGTGAWGNTQDVYHDAFANGCTVNAGVIIPAKSDGSSDAQGNPIGYPAGALHPITTAIDFTGGVPESNPWPTSHNHGDGLPTDPPFYNETDDDGGEWRFATPEVYVAGGDGASIARSIARDIAENIAR